VGCREGLTLSWGNQIRTAGPILVFIDRGGRSETNTDGTALVDIGAFAGRAHSANVGYIQTKRGPLTLIKPFRALRPAPGRAVDVLAPPYDVLS
jgi:hypothetical protein